MTTSLRLLQTGMGNGKLPFVFCKWKRKTEVCFPLSANDSCFSRVPIYGYTYEQCIDQVHVHIYAESWPAVVCLLNIVHQLFLFSTFRPTFPSFHFCLSLSVHRRLHDGTPLWIIRSDCRLIILYPMQQPLSLL